MDRFSPHESVYFIYGPDTPAAKFQFSFKYRLSTLHQRTPASLPTTLQFGYTQRSLWDIDGNSSPFYDTSYMPAVFIERLAAAPDEADYGLSWLGLQAGFGHESNGRDGDVSRSYNKVFARVRSTSATPMPSA
ncbi:MAG: phospholipase A [Candidatus Synoicihabitans palmerolidicus]|nr:phospholipase A [Candidatus Synoicihabitans palmerolidicus]